LSHGIIGLNGAGKTTFFNVLSTFLKSGTVELDGHSIRRQDVAFLETHNFFYSNLTGKEYLDIFPQTNLHFNLDTINNLLQLPLKELIETYSTGMKKKLALLSIIKQDKPVYILDEPFNGLDMETNQVLEMMIARLRAIGKTVFISSHILSPLLNVCDKIHLLQNGTFLKTYEQAQFKNINEELFLDFREKTGDIIRSMF
jgi:ABC-2 type transport system ATP-binding protein